MRKTEFFAFGKKRLLAVCDGSHFAVTAKTHYFLLLAVTDDSGNAITDMSNIANLNSIRYRGYYYDVETGFYYLQSRYYDPTVGRFINADALVSTGQGLLGYNMYAYCGNNPVNMEDPNGYACVRECGAVCGAGIAWDVDEGYIITFASSLPTTGKPNSKDTLYNPDGTPKQERWYGPNGKPLKDRDYNHPGNHEFPHDHIWDDGVRKPSVPVPKTKSDPSYADIGKDVIVSAGAVGVGYLIYRGIRMIPSLFPALWWTIPANVAIP